MTDKEITSLAREYAEETKNGILEFFPRPLPDSMEVLIKNDQEYYGRFLRFLLRRFCLVKKEVIRKEYESVKDTPEESNYEELGATWDEVPYLSRFYDAGYNCGQKELLESLFPEIAKEVEG